jgi:serine phosphatase RsbU (regulator of sigma subunit)
MSVIRDGETVAYEEVDADTLASGLPTDVPRDLVERLAPTSTIIVPLVGRGAVVGAMTLTRRGGRYDDEDRRFAEELGRHVGLAVANAALFERERAVAEALQQSLLPPGLPEIDGLDIAARYEPGGTRLVVGGDFYDLFQTEPGTWFALVGDVCGTGAEAAAITSQVRYTARALAGRVDGPAVLLDEINAALLERGDTRFCTAQVVRLRPGPDGVEVTLSSGGHPPPVLITRSGTRLLDCPGTLLGIYADANHHEVDLVLAKGEALALYTDGVTETRDADGVLLGEERLVEVLDACVEEDAEKTATQLIQAAVDHAEFAPADDIAVLVLRHA